MPAMHERFKALTHFFKKLDYFGVQFSFDYKYNKKYRTAFGGFIFFLFLVALVVFIVINIGGFIRRENMSVIYYSLKMSTTDQISFTNYSSTMAFKLECGSVPSKDVYDLLSLDAKFVTNYPVDGVRKREKIPLKHSPCTKENFYNEFDSSFDLLGLGNYECLDMGDTQMEGQYTDDVFNYYEMLITTNSENFEEENKAEKLINLTETQECQFSLCFIDTMIDINSYSHPIKRFLNQDFIVLKPTEFIKKNSYYKAQQFNWDNNWIIEKVGLKYYMTKDYSEEYSLYKGIDRFKLKPDYYENLATIYLRASLSRNIISRKYAKLTEFIADQTSIFSKILLFLAVSVMYMNYYCAYKSIIKKFFKISNPEEKQSRLILKDIKTFFKNESIDLIDESDQVSEGGHSENTVKPLPVETADGKAIGTKIPNSKPKKKNKEKEVEELRKKYAKEGLQVTVKEKEKPEDTGKKRNVNFMRKVILSYLCPLIKVDKSGVDKKLKAIEANFFLKMDVRSYIKTSQIVDMLNYLLLSEKRAGMLSFISNPCISFGNTDILKTIDCNMKTFFDIERTKLKEFLVDVSEMKRKPNKSTLDEKLLKLMTNELQNVIDNGNK